MTVSGEDVFANDWAEMRGRLLGGEVKEEPEISLADRDRVRNILNEKSVRLPGSVSVSLLKAIKGHKGTSVEGRCTDTDTGLTIRTFADAKGEHTIIFVPYNLVQDIDSR